MAAKDILLLISVWAVLASGPAVAADFSESGLPADWAGQINRLTRIGDIESASKCAALGKLAVQQTAQQGLADVALAHNEYGQCLLSLGKPQDALTEFQQAADVWNKLGDRSDYATAQSGVAVALINQGRYGEAIHLLRDVALPGYSQSGDESSNNRINVLISLSSAYIYSANYSAGIDTLKNAESLAVQPPRPYQLGGIHTNLGYAYVRMGRLKLAREEFNRGSVEFKENGYLRGAAYATNGLCETLLRQAAGAGPVKCFQDAIAEYSAVPDATLNAALRLNEAQALDAAGQCDRALETWLDVLALARTKGLHEIEGRAFGSMINCLEARHSSRAAVLAGYAAIARFAAVRQNLEQVSRPAARGFIDSKQDIYRRLIRLLVLNDRIGEAEEVVGQMKDEEYFQFTRGDKNLTDPSAINKDDRVDEITSRATQALVALGAERKVLLDKQRAGPISVTEQRRMNQLDDALEAARKSFFSELDRLVATQPRHPSDVMSGLRYLDAFRDTLVELGPDVVLLTYVTTDDEVVGILTTGTVHPWRVLPINRAKLAGQVFAFRQAIEDYRHTPKKTTQALGQELYQELLAPFMMELAHLRVSVVMLSLDGPLRYLPFAALYDGRQYVVDHFATALYTPAATLSLKDLPRPHWRIAGLGVSKAENGLRPLVFVPDELGAIVNSSPPWDHGLFPGEVCLDECFTVGAIKKVLNGQYPVLHIASHFVFKPGNESSSYLVLGDGTELTLREIRESDLRFAGIDLLTLSACETAVGREDPSTAGLEVEGFAVLAQNQGAKGVLATLWPAFDHTTADIMGAFYKAQLPPGRLNKATALKQAQVRAKGRLSQPGGPDFSLPFFWAPFVIAGNWR